MTRTKTPPHRRRALFAVAPALLLWAFPAHAAQEDMQAWLNLTSVVPVDEDTTATIEISPRWREEGADLLQTRATIELDLSPSVSIAAGAAYIEYAGGSEYRPHQQVSFDAGAFSFRTRLEQRFFEDEPRPQIRLRQRVSTSVPVGEQTDLKATVEYLHNLRPERREDESGVDSWRGLVGVEQELSQGLSLEVNYHIIFSPREDGPDHISHIPRMTLTKRF